MVNFRFHLVSLTAVFLALAIGIGIGATVVDQGQVDVIKGQLDSVRKRTDETNAENERLQAVVEDTAGFEEQVGNQLVAGHLEGVPVLLVSTDGVDRKPVDGLRQTIVAAGASFQGALWFTSKVALTDDGDINTLGTLLEIESRRAEVVRRALINRLASALTSTPTPFLAALRDAGFVEFEGGGDGAPDLAAIPTPGSRVVVASDSRATAPNAEWAIPLALTLGGESNATTLAVEAGRFDGSPPADTPAPFVQGVRADEQQRGRLATVDNIGRWRGRMAAVLAIAGLVNGRTGHFGEGPGADRQVPEPAGQ